jgi:hypothetical protein
MRDIDMESTPVMINIRASKSKNKQGRFTFITPEAAEAVKAWLKNRDDYLRQSAKHNQNLQKITVSKKGEPVKTAPVKTESDLLFPVSDSQINQAWETCLRKAGLYAKDTESGRNVYRLHSLRKFFISSVSLAGAKTLAEHLAGHLGYLDSSYRQVSPEYAAAEYLKLQNILTVCIDPVIKNELHTQKEDIKNLTEKTQVQFESVEYLRESNARLQDMLKQQQGELQQMTRRLDAMEKDRESDPDLLVLPVELRRRVIASIRRAYETQSGK